MRGPRVVRRLEHICFKHGSSQLTLNSTTTQTAEDAKKDQEKKEKEDQPCPVIGSLRRNRHWS
jgi:hypothetical protein